jgi:hypothetical protein
MNQDLNLKKKSFFQMEPSIKVKLKMAILDMVMAHKYGLMGQDMKDIGLIMLLMVEVNSITLMEIFMMVKYMKMICLGEWKNDKANGYGTYTHANGSSYIGEWLDDK